MSMQEQSQQTGQEDMQDQAGFARDQQAMDPEAERRQDQMQSQAQTEQQDDRSSDRADVDRLIRRVQHEHPANLTSASLVLWRRRGPDWR